MGNQRWHGMLVILGFLLGGVIFCGQAAPSQPSQEHEKSTPQPQSTPAEQVAKLLADAGMNVYGGAERIKSLRITRDEGASVDYVFVARIEVIVPPKDEARIRIYVTAAERGFQVGRLVLVEYARNNGVFAWQVHRSSGAFILADSCHVDFFD